MAEEDVSDLFSEVSDISYISDIDNLPNSIQYDISNGCPQKLKCQFKIAHYNINSITADNRIETLTDLCKTLNIHILILTETKLDETIPNNIILLDGFHEPIRHDRELNGRNGGGCMIFIAETLTYKHQINRQSNHFEHLWVDVQTDNKILAVNCFYRPPNETAEDHDFFLKTAEQILKNLSEYRADVKVISSDLNFGNCYCVEPILPPKPLDKSAPQLFSSYGFNQLIDIPTRLTLTTTSLIDLLYVESQDLVDQFGTLPQIADHEGTLLCLNITQKSRQPTQKIIFDYRNADVEGMNGFIKQFKFENSIFGKLSVPNQTQAYSDILKDCFEKFVPKKTVFLRPNSIPWCNPYTRLLLRKKNLITSFSKTFLKNT